MGRPDFSLLARQQRGVADSVGETALLRTYVSADTFAPMSEAVGVGEASYYSTRIITGLFAPPSFPEMYAPGGQLVTGDMAATLIDVTPGPHDEIQWRGVNYRVASDPITQQLLGRSAYRMILRRAQPTAG